MSRDLIPVSHHDDDRKGPNFSETWEEFDSQRQDLISKNSDFWRGVDSGFAEFDDLVRSRHETMDREMEGSMPKVPEWAIPEEQKKAWRPMLRQDRDRELASLSSDGGPFEVVLDVRHYPADQLKVKVSGDTLVVEGKDNGGKKDKDGDDEEPLSSQVTRSFHRKWTLPEGCDADAMTSDISEDGILRIRAPRKRRN